MAALTLTRIVNARGAAAGLVGAFVALQLALARALGSATPDSVTFAGRGLDMACSFKQRTGVPCPNCGMTRSVLLALQGDVGASLALNPAGTLLVFGLALFSAAMLLLMFFQQTRGAESAARAQRRITWAAAAYGVLFVAVLVGHWLKEVL
jgi:Protein of unknown function (DUF2752)